MANSLENNRAFLKALCYEAGRIVPSETPTKILARIVERQRAKYCGEHSIPNQDSEILEFVMRMRGADDNEIQRALDELIPIDVLASIEDVSVETVKENREQAKEARKAHGVFSSEAREARQDLRLDRRSSRVGRRERRRDSMTGTDRVNNFVSLVGALK